jgi:hypothetical protein
MEFPKTLKLATDQKVSGLNPDGVTYNQRVTHCVTRFVFRSQQHLHQHF